MSETLVCSHNNNNNDVLINHAHIETLSYPNMPDNAGIRYVHMRILDTSARHGIGADVWSGLNNGQTQAWLGAGRQHEPDAIMAAH